MDALHIALLLASAAACAAALVGGDRLDRRTGVRHLSQLGVIVGGALVVGNVVSLLPGTPAWYSAGLAVLTVVGLGWLVLTVAAARPRPAAPVTRRPLYAVGGADVVDAEIVEDDAPRRASVTSIAADPPRRVVTADEIDAAAPDGAEATRGETYVATRIADYLPETRRGHSRRRRILTPEEQQRRLRVMRAYAIGAERRGTLHNTHG